MDKCARHVKRLLSYKRPSEPSAPAPAALASNSVDEKSARKKQRPNPSSAAAASGGGGSGGGGGGSASDQVPLIASDSKTGSGGGGGGGGTGMSSATKNKSAEFLARVAADPKAIHRIAAEMMAAHEASNPKKVEPILHTVSNPSQLEYKSFGGADSKQRVAFYRRHSDQYLFVPAKYPRLRFAEFDTWKTSAAIEKQALNDWEVRSSAVCGFSCDRSIDRSIWC